MGIQRFASRLNAYSHPVLLDHSMESRLAIVDGPGLVHHIYYRLCDTSKATVGYSSCAEEIVAWLDTLTSFGFKMEAIFFDGALPPTKKDIRIERLQAYIARLVAFKQNPSATLSRITPELRKSLPPPPFIVFAVVEELLLSKYASYVHVVPGEADPYCVAAALQASVQNGDTAVTIFSDDSDLLVYNYSGHSTRIITLRDLTAISGADKPSWSGVEYWPSQIAERAPNPSKDLIKPAYVMSKDLYISLDRALRDTAEQSAEDPDFDAFAETFSIVAESADWAKIKSKTAASSDLSVRDSRVSELIWQLQSSSSGKRMYLPFLTDDVSRSTAWNVAADLRQLAYSTLLQSFKCETSIQEYRRSGTRVASVLVDQLSDADIASEASGLSIHISELLKWVQENTQLDETQAWSYLAIQHVLRHYLADSQALPNVDDIIQAVAGRKESKWHVLHLNAQYQAAFYSLRILKQILSYTLSGQAKEDLDDPLMTLSSLLCELPRITVFFAERSAESRKQEHIVWREVLNDLLASLKKEAEPDAVSSEENGRPRKKAKKNKTDSNSSAMAKNPFAMLAEES